MGKSPAFAARHAPRAPWAMPCISIPTRSISRVLGWSIALADALPRLRLAELMCKQIFCVPTASKLTKTAMSICPNTFGIRSFSDVKIAI